MFCKCNLFHSFAFIRLINASNEEAAARAITRDNSEHTESSNWTENIRASGLRRMLKTERRKRNNGNGKVCDGGKPASAKGTTPTEPVRNNLNNNNNNNGPGSVFVWKEPTHITDQDNNQQQQQQRQTTNTQSPDNPTTSPKSHHEATHPTTQEQLGRVLSSYEDESAARKVRS